MGIGHHFIAGCSRVRVMAITIIPGYSWHFTGWNGRHFVATTGLIMTNLDKATYFTSLRSTLYSLIIDEPPQVVTWVTNTLQGHSSVEMTATAQLSTSMFVRTLCCLPIIPWLGGPSYDIFPRTILVLLDERESSHNHRMEVGDDTHGGIHLFPRPATQAEMWS